MKRITLTLMTALLAAGYANASFASDTNNSSSGSSVSVGQSSTDYYRHRRHHHCRRGWFDNCDDADADSGADTVDMD